ncbi:MAG: oligosaccharide flippase family protein [Armatimonadetes bacterium]|nr:oligosaccharide flippase family protein [Armatimonadota bacterium]
MRLKPKSDFSRQVLTLATGTAIAQVLPLAALPIVSRLYTQSQVGILTLFLSIASVLGIIATGRYELAIMLPEEDEDAVNLLAISITCSVVFAVLTLLIAVFFNGQICSLLESREIGPWLYWIPATLIANAAYQAYNYWFNRKEMYHRLAVNRIGRSAITEGSKIGFGTLALSHIGLVIGTVLGQTVTALRFFWQARHEDRASMNKISWVGMRKMLGRYRDFPRYTVPAEVVNDLSKRLPVFILAGFGSTVTGNFGMAQMVMGGPLGILGSAFADVFKQRASRDFIEHGECRALWLRTFKKLILISVPVFTLAYLLAPVAFKVILGPKWVEAGYFAQALTPYYALAFIASPLSRTLYVAEDQHLDLIWQLGLVVGVYAALTFGEQTGNVLTTLRWFAWTYTALYAIYLLLSYRSSCGKTRS